MKFVFFNFIDHFNIEAAEITVDVVLVISSIVTQKLHIILIYIYM